MRADIFDHAADLLEEKGWTRNNYCRDGKRCALGALYEVIGQQELGLATEDIWTLGDGDDIYSPARTVLDISFGEGYENELLRTINEGHYRTRFFDVPDWNDDASRRREQVVRAFRKTAERVRNAE